MQRLCVLPSKTVTSATGVDLLLLCGKETASACGDCGAPVCADHKNGMWCVDCAEMRSIFDYENSVAPRIRARFENLGGPEDAEFFAETEDCWRYGWSDDLED